MSLRRTGRKGMAVEFIDDSTGKRYRMTWLKSQRRLGAVHCHFAPKSGRACWIEMPLHAPPKATLEALVLPRDIAVFIAASIREG